MYIQNWIIESILKTKTILTAVYDNSTYKMFSNITLPNKLIKLMLKYIQS